MKNSTAHEQQNRLPPIIQFEGVRYGWQSNVPVLEVPQFQIGRAERIFLRGPSGSGKSTFLGLLGGVLSPWQGTVKVLGQDLTRLSPSKRDQFRADHVGIVFQMFNLLPYLSLTDNVCLPCRFSSYRNMRARHRHDETIQQEAHRLLHHLQLDESLWSRPVSTLSVGQQQRVAVARALIGRPEVLIADEPTSALDTDRRDAFLDLLLNECKLEGTTLIFVSHDRSLATHFDRQVDMDEINVLAGAPSPLQEVLS